MTDQEWKSLLYLKPSDFKYPGGLRYGIVKSLDQFIGMVGLRPIILSDYRSGDPRQHGSGNAIDTTWPGLDPVDVYEKAEESKLFGGIGLYINEAGITSFHFDARPLKETGEPSRWGGVITHPYDPVKSENIRRTEYVGLDVVLDMVKKKGLVVITALGLLGLTIFLFTRR